MSTFDISEAHREHSSDLDVCEEHFSSSMHLAEGEEGFAHGSHFVLSSASGSCPLRNVNRESVSSLQSIRNLNCPPQFRLAGEKCQSQPEHSKNNFSFSRISPPVQKDSHAEQPLALRPFIDSRVLPGTEHEYRNLAANERRTPPYSGTPSKLQGNKALTAEGEECCSKNIKDEYEHTFARCSGRVRRNDLASTSTNIPPNSQPTVRDLFAVFQAKHQHNQQLLQHQEQQFCQDKEYGTARRSRGDARHHHVTPRSPRNSRRGSGELRDDLPAPQSLTRRAKKPLKCLPATPRSFPSRLENNIRTHSEQLHLWQARNFEPLSVQSQLRHTHLPSARSAGGSHRAQSDEEDPTVPSAMQAALDSYPTPPYQHSDSQPWSAGDDGDTDASNLHMVTSGGGSCQPQSQDDLFSSFPNEVCYKWWCDCSGICGCCGESAHVAVSLSQGHSFALPNSVTQLSPPHQSDDDDDDWRFQPAPTSKARLWDVEP